MLIISRSQELEIEVRLIIKLQQKKKSQSQIAYQILTLKISGKKLHLPRLI